MSRAYVRADRTQHDIRSLDFSPSKQRGKYFSVRCTLFPPWDTRVGLLILEDVLRFEGSRRPG